MINTIDSTKPITVTDLTIGYDNLIVQQNLNFTIEKGEVFVVMGDSGCGKSTLMRSLIGISSPLLGDVYLHGENLWRITPAEREAMMHYIGVLYQSGALWSSLTLFENVALPLKFHTGLSEKEIAEVVSYKLSLVGLEGFEEFFPSEISGGMCKRAGLARAMALDPDILFFDEPSAGLDPLNAKLLDDLILELRDSLGATIIVVTHELASIFAIADRALFLDSDTKTMTGLGTIQELFELGNEKICLFLNRGVVSEELQ